MQLHGYYIERGAMNPDDEVSMTVKFKTLGYVQIFVVCAHWHHVPYSKHWHLFLPVEYLGSAEGVFEVILQLHNYRIERGAMNPDDEASNHL